MTGRDSLVPFVSDPDFVLYVGDVHDVLAKLPDESVDCCVTSPPYWGLRDYGVQGQLGLEPTPEEYVARMVAVFAEVRRVLRPDGTCWLNIGDSYAGSWGAQSRGNTTGEDKTTLGGTSMLSARQIEAHPKGQTLTGSLKRTPGLKQKDLVGIPWRVAFALQQDGWYLRSDIIWSKPNPMPESVTDRPTKSHEYLFLLTKSARYFYDADAIAEPATWYGPNGQPKSGPHAGQMRGRAGKNESTGDRRKVGFNERWDANDGDHPLTRNARSVWTIQTQQYADAHFAVYPEELPRRCIAAGCPAGGTVLDPFMGSGTTALVARKLGRNAIGVELNEQYAEICARRLAQLSLLAEAVGE